MHGPWRASTLRLADVERLANAIDGWRSLLAVVAHVNSYTCCFLLGEKSTKCWAGRYTSRIPPTPTTSSVQPGWASGRLLGRARAPDPPTPLTFKSLNVQVSPTLAQFLPVPLLHLELRYACTLLYFRPRRPCICLLGTPLCQSRHPSLGTFGKTTLMTGRLFGSSQSANLTLRLPEVNPTAKLNTRLSSSCPQRAVRPESKSS
jgi:hypothetical protein